MVRIGIKGKYIFDKIYAARVNRGQEMGDEAINQMMMNYNKRENDANEAESPGHMDSYENIKETTKHTIQGLFIYLDLPREKQELYDKLHDLKSRNVPFNEKKQRI